MACNSVAVTSATIAQVNLSSADLRDLLASLLKTSADKVESGSNIAYSYIAGGIVMIQSGKSGKVELTIQSNSGSLDQRAVDKMMGELQPQFEKLLIVAQQKVVITRLQKLGKLSKIQSKDNGVTMRLEINV